MTGSHEVRGSIPLGSTISTVSETLYLTALMELIPGGRVN